VKKIYFSFLILILAACTPNPKIDPSKPPVPEPVPFSFKGEWPKQEYTDALVKELRANGQDMLSIYPTDWDQFCKSKALTEDQKIQFYVTLISALSYYESSYNPKATYVEPDIYDRLGKHVVSAGLLQLSIESGNAYKCALKQTSDLFDPATNLKCGVIIMNRWVGQIDKVIYSPKSPWRGAARYWSPFRKADRIARFKQKTMALDFCK